MFKYQFLDGNNILERYQKAISGIRTGRVNATVLDSLVVEAYDSHMSIKELATITLPEPTQILITPFDKTLIPKIAKTINNSNLGVNPDDDGAGIRLKFPPMTEETRKERVKDLHKLQEEAKKQVRIERQEFLRRKKKEKEDSIISENDYNRFEDVLQREVDNVNKEIEQITKNKEEEIMKV